MPDTESTNHALDPGRPQPDNGGQSQRLDKLALLYEGILTAIVRVQSGRQQIQGSEAFRNRMKSALKEIARAAAKRGYASEDVQEANFAVIAFLDEAVLTSSDPGRSQWARKTLQEELFEQRAAGELFFKRLEALRANRDSPQLVQVLEVYYLCLLLGYEGRYAVGPKAELHVLMDNVRERIERISGRTPYFSPEGQLPAEQPRAAATDALPGQLRLLAIAALVFVILCFTALKVSIVSKAGDLRAQIQQTPR